MAEIMTRNCETCGKEFTTNNPVTKYCSVECRKKAKARYHAGWLAQKREETRKRLGTRICVVCGKEFEPRNSTISTCGPICSKERQKALDKERSREARAEKRNKKKKKSKIEPAWKVNEKARAMGLSYGKYQLKMQMEAQKAERGCRECLQVTVVPMLSVRST